VADVGVHVLRARGGGGDARDAVVERELQRRAGEGHGCSGARPLQSRYPLAIRRLRLGVVERRVRDGAGRENARGERRADDDAEASLGGRRRRTA
jgi:hypothetical protein